MSWAKPKSWWERAIANLLTPAELIYTLAGYVRLLAYRIKLLPQRRFPAETISVGNITCGGTGKTPVTIELARQLLAAGKRVAVLSRGYKRQSQAQYLVVSDGQGNIVDCAAAGDEPFLIAQSVPKAVVIVGSRRVETAAIAIAQFGCNTLLLDDGFQHLPIERDRNIVLIDYNDDLWNSRVLPAGRLREPLSALSRADSIVITKLPTSPDLDRLFRLQALASRNAPSAKLSCCRMVPTVLIPLGSNDVRLPASSLRGTRVFVCSGIGNPAAFIEQLEDLGAHIVGQKQFPDHYWYTAADVLDLRQASREVKAEIIVTTEKDAVKLQRHSDDVNDLPIAALGQRLEWLGEDLLDPPEDRSSNVTVRL